MHETQTVHTGSVCLVAEKRSKVSLCQSLLFFLLLAGSLLAPPASAAAAQETPEIAIDNAVISSPQTTLASLLRLTETFHDLVRDEGFTRKNEPRVRNILQQVEKLFDLSSIPQKYRRNVAAETAVYLRESLARFPIPAIKNVPDEDEMAARIRDGKAALYRLPGTPVVIKRTDTGIYEGRYQFSSATVAEARNWFEVANAYPYLKGQDHISGLYHEYFLTPGPMIPVKLIRALPDWMQHYYQGQTVWQWLLLVATTLILIALLALLYIVFKRIAAGRSRIQRNLILMLWPIGVIYLTQAARSFLEGHVFLTGEVLQIVLFVSKLVILAAIVSLIMRIGSVVTEAVLAARHFETRKVDQQLVRLGVRMLTILIAVIVVMEGMQQIGFSLATLVAGAGVTGLAIALAAQDTLKNVFGGLLLAMDRPFEVGQRVKIKGYEGFIQEVGLRSTKVRTLAGHQIILPNDEAARLEVENIGRRPFIRRDLNISITYDTPPEKIAQAVEILREILAVPEPVDEADKQTTEPQAPHPNEAINKPGLAPKVYFNNLNTDSLNLLVVYWFHPPDQWQNVAFAHRVNMQIMERFNAEGIDFAFPSQTMYLAGDNKRPLSLEPKPSTSRTTPLTDPGSPRETTQLDASPIEEELMHGEDGNGTGDASSTS